MKPIVVVGSYNTGLTMLVERLPLAGETLLGRGYSEGPGGKGSNQAVAAKRLGGRVSFVGCVGSDRRGDDALALWRREGVDCTHVRRTGVHTGLGFVIVDRSGRNAITVDAGANLELNAEDLRGAEPAISKAGVMLLQLEVPVDAVHEAARLARRHGATVILNPAPARPSGLDFGSFDILTPNEQEFEVLAGTGELDRGSSLLLSKGAKAVVVTLGERGAFVATASDSYTVPAPRVSVIDSTGAGDAFNGALAVALSEGEPLRQAVTFANYAGALTVTRKEVIPALPRRTEVEEFRRNDVLE
ncbi:MAG: ribokinase [Nitrososphaerota archaeon]|nr:ribokinase [Nitrososphaerota archaeon]